MKNSKEEKNNGASKIDLDILELKQAQKNLEEFIVETRRMAVLQSHSIDYLNYQFKRILADNFALTQSLTDVEKEVAQRYASYEMAMRERARLKETVEHQHRLLNLALQQYKAVADENILLRGKIDKLTKELQAKDQIITAIDGVLQTIQRLIQQRKLPADTIAELQQLIAEIPKPLKEVKETKEEATHEFEFAAEELE